MVLQASDISFPIAYLAGFLMFFAPCLLPIVPAYISYMAGLSLQDAQHAKGGQAQKNRRKLLGASLAFVAGFLAVFLLFGLGASYLGAKLYAYRKVMQIFGGILMIVVGAYIAGLFEGTWLSKSAGLRLSRGMTRFAVLNAFIIGLSFGFSWTPCVGPVLAVILFWASQADSVWRGVSLLFVYGLGVGTPLVLVAVFIQRASRFLQAHSRGLSVMTKVSGVVIMVAGVLLLGNWLFALSRFFSPLGSLELLFDVR